MTLAGSSASGDARIWGFGESERNQTMVKRLAKGDYIIVKAQATIIDVAYVPRGDEGGRWFVVGAPDQRKDDQIATLAFPRIFFSRPLFAVLFLSLSSSYSLIQALPRSRCRLLWATTTTTVRLCVRAPRLHERAVHLQIRLWGKAPRHSTRVETCTQCGREVGSGCATTSRVKFTFYARICQQSELCEIRRLL